MMPAKHSKKGPAMEDRSQGTCMSCYCCGATPSHPEKECPARDAVYYKCSKKVGKAKDVKRKQKPATVPELEAQATAGT